jgi:hypothetical protein
LKKLDCSLLDEVSNKILAFSDLMSVMASSPTYIHSPIEDTDCYIIETKDNELWVSTCMGRHQALSFESIETVKDVGAK